MIFEILIPGKPMGKQRPKATTRGHRAGVYTDDSHITEMTISKYYSDEPRVEIMIEEER